MPELSITISLDEASKAFLRELALSTIQESVMTTIVESQQSVAENLATLQSSIDTHNVKMTALQEELAAEKQQVAQFTQSFVSIAAENVSLKQVVADLTGQVETLVSELQTSENFNNQVVSQLQMTTATINDQVTKLDEAIAKTADIYTPETPMETPTEPTPAV